MRRILRDHIRPHLLIIGLAVFCMMISAAMTGALAKLMEPVIDDIFTEKNYARLLPVALMILAAFTLRGAATFGHTVLMGKAGQAMIAEIQQKLFARLIRMDINFFQKYRSGHLLIRMVSDTSQMRVAMADSVTGIIKSTLTLAVLLAVMFYQDWKLTLAALFVFPLAAYFVVLIGKKLRRVATALQEEAGDLTGILGQSFQGIRHIRAYGLEEYETGRVAKNVRRIYKLFCKSIRVSAITNPVSELLSGIAIVTIIVYGGHQVMEGTTTAGKLFSFITAFLLAYEPMKRLAKLNAVLQTGLAAAQRVFDIMDVTPQIVNKPSAKALQLHSAPALEFENIDFSYPESRKIEGAETALSGLSLSVPAGKTVALVGPSGAGKSTVMNLILRFYDMQSGRILIDDKDIRSVTMESLRAHISYVSQDITVFSDTVRDNIRCARFDASDAEVEEAAKAATAHDFIMELESGYDTVLGENGTNLSGGQRQRIAIARAILRNAPLLLLDEATSALDNESERAVQTALERLRRGRTTLVVAHRLSTVQSADLIYVLDQGRAVESGTHAELLKTGGLYNRLYGGKTKR
ncbi:MAG: ABC transporter ATP-binding protein [Micavibrio sp.]|nr:MAG: ABC transporter ATP-binding protein [Micavibrio sp.]